METATAIGNLFYYGIGAFLTILITAAIFRWIFSIKRQLWNQKMQIELLMTIAEKLGADTHNEDFSRIKEANRGTIDL